MSDAITIQYNVNGTPRSKTVSFDGKGIATIDRETCAAGGDTVFVFAIDVSALELLIVESDVSVSIDTNAGDDTLTITAGKPLVWFDGCGLASPFVSEVDVASLTVTVPGGLDAPDAVVTVKVVTDPTPPGP